MDRGALTLFPTNPLHGKNSETGGNEKQRGRFGHRRDVIYKSENPEPSSWTYESIESDVLKGAQGQCGRQAKSGCEHGTVSIRENKFGKVRIEATEVERGSRQKIID